MQIVNHVDVVARQIGSGGVVEGIVSEGKTYGHAFSARDLARDVDDGGGVVRFLADLIRVDGVVRKCDRGIVLQVVPTAGACAVERLAADGDARAHGNDQGVAGRLARHGIRRDGGAFDIRRDVVLHIVVSNARVASYRAISGDQASGHGGGDGDAMVLPQ